MPANKDFKRLVRGRMQKTGEAYTTARAMLLSQTSVLSGPPPEDYAKIAGTSDAALKAKTGCAWERWVRALDRAGASAWPHREIATYVRSHYKIGDWWSQTVTVGYERIKGLRERGQLRGGAFRTNKSKTFPVTLARLYGAWSSAPKRRRWLPGVELVVRTASKDRSMRITWPDGTNVDVGFAPRGAGKAQVAVEHSRLKTKAQAESAKQFWEGRLGELGKVLVK